MAKIFTKICTAIFGLWAITRCILDYWSYFETGKSVFENRGEFLKNVGPILGSQWFPLVLFLSGVALLILLEIVSRRTESEEATRLHAFPGKGARSSCAAK